MAKKKTNKASEKTASSLREALGIDKIFFNERINFVLGFCLLIIAGYLIWAFISYFATGAADQSLIDSPRDGEIMNEAREFQNWEPMQLISSSSAALASQPSSSPSS